MNVKASFRTSARMRGLQAIGGITRMLTCGWPPVLLVGALAGVIISGEILADETPKPGAREVRLVPIQFLPVNNEIKFSVDQGGLGRLCSHGGAGYFVAALPPRDGSSIEAITVQIEDDSPEAFGMMSLMRAGGPLELVTATAPSAGTGEVEEIAAKVVPGTPLEAGDGKYMLQVVLTGPGVCLHGATIFYRAP